MDLEALARRFVVAYELKDIATIAELFSPDIVLRDWNSEVVGYEAAIDEFTNNFRAADSIKINVRRIMASENAVAAELEIVIDDVEILRVVDVLTFGKDQKILSIVAYKGL